MATLIKLILIRLGSKMIAALILTGWMKLMPNIDVKWINYRKLVEVTKIIVIILLFFLQAYSCSIYFEPAESSPDSSRYTIQEKVNNSRDHRSKEDALKNVLRTRNSSETSANSDRSSISNRPSQKLNIVGSKVSVKNLISRFSNIA